MTLARRFTRLGGLLVAALVVASVAAGCSSGGTASIKVTGSWARASSAMAAAAAAYMTIENTGSTADALVGAASPASTDRRGPRDGGHGIAGPGRLGRGRRMMGMQPIARLEIPAGGSVELTPGSYHIMLIDLKQDLKVGDTIEITLTFEKAGEIKVTAEVRES